MFGRSDLYIPRLCVSTCAPLFTKGHSIRFCSERYWDAALLGGRSWSVCSNFKPGCVQFAEARRGGKCYACINHALPCLHALSGCTRHVRPDPYEPPRKRRACSSHGTTRCNFNPEHPRACETPRCGNIVLGANKISSSCASGMTPCTNTCSRRAAPNKDGRCDPCSSLVVGDALAGANSAFP